jgi:hypothetical protein
MITPSSSPDVVAVAVHGCFYGCGTGAGNSNRTFLTILLPLPATGRPARPSQSRQWQARAIAEAWMPSISALVC